MAQGEGGSGNFAGTGGYGGQFGGFGGASAGYGGGYGNPSSVGGGTAGQTYASQNYANTLNKYNPSLPNYSGGPTLSGSKMAGGAVTPEWLAEQAKKKAVAPTTAPTVTAPTVTTPETHPPNVPTDPNFDPNWSRPEGEWGYPGSGNFQGFQGLGGISGPVLGGVGAGAGINSGLVGGSYQGGKPGAGRQFGGPVGPGQYTVGENGPETLRLGGGSRGMVTPNNPADRRAGLVAALQGRPGGGFRGGGITGMGGGGGLGAPRPAPMPGAGGGMPRPATLPAPAPRPMAGAGGGWRG